MMFIVRDICISFNLDLFIKVKYAKKDLVKRHSLMEYLSNYHKECLKEQENIQNQHLHVTLRKSHWKLIQQYDKNFLMEGKQIEENVNFRTNK